MAVVLIAGELTALAIALTIAVNAALIIVVVAASIELAMTLSQTGSGASQLMGGSQGIGHLLDSLSHQANPQNASLNVQELPSRQLPDRSAPVNQLPSRQLPDRTDPRAWQPPGVILPTIPQCPPGYSWNPQTERCEPNVTIPIQPPSGSGGSNQFLDALQTFCKQCLEPEIAAPLGALADTLVAALGPGSPILAMATALLTLANQLGPEIPLLGTILPNLIGALTNLDLAALVSATDSIRAQIETCCTEIRTALAQQLAAGDVPQPIIDEMIKEGSMSPALGQLASGAPWAHVISALIGSIAKYLGGELGDATHGIGLLTQNLIEPWARKLLSFVESVADQFLDTAKNNAGAFGPKLNTLIQSILKEAASLETTIPRDVFDAVVQLGGLSAATTPDEIEVAAFSMFGLAFGVGQLIHLLSGIASFLGYPMSSVWANNASLLVDLLAFDEIKAAIHDPFFKAAIESKSSQHFLSVHRPYPLSLGEASMAFGRREIPDVEFERLAALAGKQAASMPSIKKLAYHPIPPFILGSAFVDQPIPHAALTGALQRGQIDPQDFAMLSTALENRSVQTLRNAVITESTTAAKAGFLSLADLDQNVNAAFATLNVNSLLHISATIGQLSEIATTTLRAALAELRTGTLSTEAAKALMTAAGIQDWRINVEVTLGAAQAAAAAARKAEAQELTFARKSFAQTLTTLGLQFLDGNINALAFTAEAEAALVTFIAVAREIGEADTALANESAQGQAMIASRLALLEAQQAGRAIMVFGLLLDRKQAFVLRARVSALEEATIRTDITPEQAHQSLLDLGIGPLEATALVDRWKLQDYPKGSAPLGKDQPRY